MKLVTFINARSDASVGMLDQGRGIADLAAVSAARNGGQRARALGSMLALIESGQTGLRTAQMTFDYACKETASAGGIDGQPFWYQPDQVKLLPPLSRPLSFRDFWIFEQHVKAGWKLRGEALPKTWYEMPTYYKGNALAMVGPDEDVIWPSYTEKLDYELEIGLIIGKKGRDIPEEKGHEYIFGYTVLNDWSARDIQRREMACRLGPAKGKDFATSMGPCIATADEIDPYNLRMTATINGEMWSDSNSTTAYWKFNQLVSHVSMGEVIYPGELFGSGTVGGGCGLELNRWLKPGDVVELEIENIGVLRNRVIKKERST